MIVIFGFGHKKVYHAGPLDKSICPRCNNEDFWLLDRISMYFTLFFIPLFPYRRIYLSYCPICGESNQLNRDEYEMLRPLAELNRSAVDGSISEEEYQRQKARYAG